MNEVKLVACSKPTGDMSADEFVAYAARVSNPANQANKDTAPRLINYLIRNNHWSPFEMVHLVMEIVTTRDIARQILRHRSFSFQEFSQRYAVPTKEMNFSHREARLQDDKNRQNSVETADKALQTSWLQIQDNVITTAEFAYKWATDHGIAKEQARVVLPEGLTLSRLYMGGTLRSWIHYCDLRRGNGTQKEHREIAIACWSIVCENFPSLKTA